MKKFVQIMFALLIMAVFTYGQDNATVKNLSQKPTDFNNPTITVGTPLTSPLNYFSESFEDPTFPPAGWSKLDPDGGTGWERDTVGLTPLPGWNGGVITAPAGGGNAVAFCTYTTGGAAANDQWLVTPQITGVQAGDILDFWTQLPGYTNAYADSLDILISTTGTNTTDFTTVLDMLSWDSGTVDTSWTDHSYTLTDYVSAGSDIYIAFREHVSDNVTYGAAVSLDLVTVTPGTPVELVSFNAVVNNNNVNLNWNTATETNNSGFAIERKSGNSDYAQIGFIQGNGTTTQKKYYSFNDNNLQAGAYTYRLKQIDFDGSFKYSNEVEANVTSPAVYSLQQNYPNPFNPTTQINFSLKVDSKVTLKVFNILGQEVVTLLNKNMTSGEHNVTFNASNLTSGIYLYKIKAAGADGSQFTSIKKMILTK
jgi:Secretion system C-terminal sorting domain/Cleaved Adhesin Domain